MKLGKNLVHGVILLALASAGPVVAACSGDVAGTDPGSGWQPGGGTTSTGTSTSASSSPSPTTKPSPTPSPTPTPTPSPTPTPTPTPTPSPTPTPTPTPTPPPPPPPDAGGSGDGTPTRQQCTSNFGSALNSSYGRLDGYLVSIVMPGSTSGCNDDSHHVHLQVMMNGGVYDVAVDVYSTQDSDPYVSIDQVSHALVGGAWSEGWHTNQSLDYVSTLGLSSKQFTEEQEAPLSQDIEQRLANANHVSIFATGYGPNGVHDVHRNSSGHDGAIVIDPLSSSPQYIVFHFSTQTF